MNTGLARLAFDHPELADLDPAARRLAIRRLVTSGAVEMHDRSTVSQLADDIDGFGCLTDLMRDEEVTDVLVNGPEEIWTERAGALHLEPVAFKEPEDLYRLIDRLLAEAGQRVDFANPLADARLSDGSRLHVALPPIAPRGPLVSIRRFPRKRLSMQDLVDRRMLGDDQAEHLALSVRDGRSLLISGGTGTGKTTLLNALLASIPPTERVILIEETPELAPVGPHHVSLVGRGANEEGTGAVDLALLLRNALRMRPDRIVVGEVRGPEAAVALAAMSTGHPGSLLTVHASSARAAMHRLVALATTDSPGAHGTLHETASRAIDLCVHLERGERRQVVEIVEV